MHLCVEDQKIYVHTKAAKLRTRTPFSEKGVNAPNGNTDFNKNT